MENSKEVEQQEVNKKKQEEQQEERKKVEIELMGLYDSFFKEDTLPSTPKQHRTRLRRPQVKLQWQRDHCEYSLSQFHKDTP